jgi:hypothetical protein
MIKCTIERFSIIVAKREIVIQSSEAATTLTEPLFKPQVGLGGGAAPGKP